ncbi:ubiquitin-like protein Pup [Flaviflexus sp. JY899]|uniref:Prokaryotic ubiquitin-like protein Pup n=2 Tax=Flaviflexus equikiangi TaxID=2758573 RepID=A0ABS2TFK9_9ACTO|nr:ubiquitin-like protein Pup [Flaviflexus equikiangi]
MTSQSSYSKRDPDRPEPDPPPIVSSAAAQDFTAILDDIDDILEENALTFVQGFIQEGGQ